MATFALLPDELLLAILTQETYVRSIKRALRLRLGSKRFAKIATIAIFNSGILDCRDAYNRIERAPDFFSEYLAYRVLMCSRRKSQDKKTLLVIAQHICHYRRASAGETLVTTTAVTDDELRECVIELCKMLTIPSHLSPSIRPWFVSASEDIPDGEVDESSLDFRRLLLSAAAWLGEKSLVVKLVEEGCNHSDLNSMLHPPLRAACYRGHVDIVKILMLDDSGEAPDIGDRPKWIVDFAILNDHTELLNIALDSSWHKGQITARDIQYLRLCALSHTCSVETFAQLLHDINPHITTNESILLPVRANLVATRGKADIMKYLIEKLGANVNEENDSSLFLSRCPAELSKQRWWFVGRDKTLLSCAAERGHVATVKVLLDAGAKHDHAIEFAAMGGSRPLVRLLWEHGENKSDAVQGAFAMAVDREDTAMFHLLEGIGAKLDDDVRAAVIQKAQKDGLESMVRLLSNDADVSC